MTPSLPFALWWLTWRREGCSCPVVSCTCVTSILWFSTLAPFLSGTQSSATFWLGRNWPTLGPVKQAVLYPFLPVIGLGILAFSSFIITNANWPRDERQASNGSITPEGRTTRREDFLSPLCVLPQLLLATLLLSLEKLARDVPRHLQGEHEKLAGTYTPYYCIWGPLHQASGNTYTISPSHGPTWGSIYVYYSHKASRLPPYTHGVISLWLCLGIFKETLNDIIPTGRMLGELPDQSRDSIERRWVGRDRSERLCNPCEPELAIGENWKPLKDWKRWVVRNTSSEWRDWLCG